MCGGCGGDRCMCGGIGACVEMCVGDRYICGGDRCLCGGDSACVEALSTHTPVVRVTQLAHVYNVDAC